MVKREGMEDLLLRYYEGETTEDETALVEEWLEASEENRRTARQVQTLGLAADMAQISSRLDVKKALKDVHRKMKQKKVNRYQVLFRGMQRAAAILFIPLMVSWSILYWDKDKEEIHMMEVRTNPGMTTSVELPDGTEVVLNSSSSLRYPSRFADDKREVKLVGEAFFSVAKDEKKFIVGTLNNSKIVVHGTEFNVEAYKGSRTVQTTLVSGKVSFSYVNNGRRNNVMMIPGQKVIYDIVREKVVVKEVNVDVETCWKDGRLIFRISSDASVRVSFRSLSLNSSALSGSEAISTCSCWPISVSSRRSIHPTGIPPILSASSLGRSATSTHPLSADV